MDRGTQDCKEIIPYPAGSISNPSLSRCQTNRTAASTSVLVDNFSCPPLHRGGRALAIPRDLELDLVVHLPPEHFQQNNHQLDPFENENLIVRH